MQTLTKPIRNPKIQAFIDGFDIESFLNTNGIKYIYSGRDQINFTCPSCRAHNKFYLSLVKKLFICFKCEIRGNLLQLVALVSGRDVKDIISDGKFGRRVNLGEGLNLQCLKSSESHYADIIEIDVESTMADFVEINRESVLLDAYLKRRNISDTAIKTWDLMYSPSHWRLIFPIFTVDKRLCGWVGRDITDTHHLKYFNNPGFRKSRILYGGHLHYSRESVVIVEGPIDALKSYQHGGLAILGKTISLMQISTLISMPNLRTIYIGIDPDQPQCAIDIANSLSSFFKVYMLNFDDGRDIGDRSESEVDLMIKSATPFTVMTTDFGFEL